MANTTGGTNLDIAPEIMALVRAEKRAGTSMTKTYEASLFWYFNRMDANGRETARRECAEWLRAQPRRIAEETEETLAKQRGKRKPAAKRRGPQLGSI